MSMSRPTERRQLRVSLGLLVAFVLLTAIGVWTVAIPELSEHPDEQGAEAVSPAEPAAPAE